MSKYRSEIINLKSPKIYADEIEVMLVKILAKNAKLKRVDGDGKTNFSFYPTKGEYLLISCTSALMAERERNEVKTK